MICQLGEDGSLHNGLHWQAFADCEAYHLACRANEGWCRRSAHWPAQHDGLQCQGRCL